jgi:hypothetical protein
MLPESNDLRELFAGLVEHCFTAYTPVHDPVVTDYVTGILTEFTKTERLYPLRNAEGHPIRELGGMLAASDPIHGFASSFDEERKVRKHIGDFALFSTGMYPDSTHTYADGTSFAELVATGKESYYIVSQFDLFEYEREAGLFARLAEQFDTCRFGLTKVREELTRLNGPKLLM